MYCPKHSLHKAQDTNIDILQTYLYQNTTLPLTQIITYHLTGQYSNYYIAYYKYLKTCFQLYKKLPKKSRTDKISAALFLI